MFSAARRCCSGCLHLNLVIRAADHRCSPYLLDRCIRICNVDRLAYCASYLLAIDISSFAPSNIVRCCGCVAGVNAAALRIQRTDHGKTGRRCKLLALQDIFGSSITEFVCARIKKRVFLYQTSIIATIRHANVTIDKFRSCTGRHQRLDVSDHLFTVHIRCLSAYNIICCCRRVRSIRAGLDV